jgi:hypothetical protein
MPNVTVYLPDDQHAYLRAHSLKASEMLQDAIRDLQLAPLEAKFREELEKYRTSPERKAEWEPMSAGEPFEPCPVCGTAEDPVEGCMAMFNPFDAAAVALLAHYPDDMRRSNLRYWEKSGFKDVTLGLLE